MLAGTAENTCRRRQTRLAYFRSATALLVVILAASGNTEATALATRVLDLSRWILEADFAADNGGSGDGCDGATAVVIGLKCAGGRRVRDGSGVQRILVVSGRIAPLSGGGSDRHCYGSDNGDEDDGHGRYHSDGVGGGDSNASGGGISSVGRGIPI